MIVGGFVECLLEDLLEDLLSVCWSICGSNDGYWRFQVCWKGGSIWREDEGVRRDNREGGWEGKFEGWNGLEGGKLGRAAEERERVVGGVGSWWRSVKGLEVSMELDGLNILRREGGSRRTFEDSKDVFSDES